MAKDRDPIFFICKKDAHAAYFDQPDFALVNPAGEPILRTGEFLLGPFMADVMMLRLPEQVWLVNNMEVHDWKVYLTSARLILVKDVVFPGALEFYDQVDRYGKLAVLHPTEEISLNQFFSMLEGKQRKRLDDFKLVVQIAITRISSISLSKINSTAVECVDFFYQDSKIKEETTQIQIFPKEIQSKDIIKIGVKLQEAALREKIECLKKKHEVHPEWEREDFNTFLTALNRLVVKPDFLAMGSAEMDEDSFNPIVLQPHPLVWDTDTFSSVYDGESVPRKIDLSY